MIANLSLERLKAKRTKAYSISFLILIIAMMWITASNLQYMRVPERRNFSIIVGSFSDLNALLFPIAIALFCSKISDIEHKGNTLKLLIPSGQNIGSLYISKVIYAGLFFTLLTLLQSIMIPVIAKKYQVPFEINMYLHHLIGLAIANLFLIAIQVFLSLKLEKQAISISIGLFGGFLGIMMSRAPEVLRQILPWGYIGVLSPVKMVSEKVGEGAVARFIPKTGLGIREIIYFMAAVGLILLFSNVLNKKRSR